MNLTVKPLPLIPGTFSHYVDTTQETLYLHPEVYKAIKHHKLREDALEFLSFAEAFPSTLAETLKWDVNLVIAAAANLRMTLSMTMPELLGPNPTIPGGGYRHPPLGANPPPFVKVEKGKTTAKDLVDAKKERSRKIAELQAKLDSAVMENAPLVETAEELELIVGPIKEQLARLYRGESIE